MIVVLLMIAIVSLIMTMVFFLANADERYNDGIASSSLLFIVAIIILSISFSLFVKYANRDLFYRKYNQYNIRHCAALSPSSSGVFYLINFQLLIKHKDFNGCDMCPIDGEYKSIECH